MIFTNADPRYAGRLDDKQGGDTIVTMERVREAIAFNAELADESGGGNPVIRAQRERNLL